MGKENEKKGKLPEFSFTSKDMIKSTIKYLLWRHHRLTAKDIQKILGLKRQRTYDYLKELVNDKELSIEYEKLKDRPNVNIAYYSIFLPRFYDTCCENLELKQAITKIFELPDIKEVALFYQIYPKFGMRKIEDKLVTITEKETEKLSELFIKIFNEDRKSIKEVIVDEERVIIVQNEEEQYLLIYSDLSKEDKSSIEKLSANTKKYQSEIYKVFDDLKTEAERNSIKNRINYAIAALVEGKTAIDKMTIEEFKKYDSYKKKEGIWGVLPIVLFLKDSEYDEFFKEFIDLYDKLNEKWGEDVQGKHDNNVLVTSFFKKYPEEVYSMSRKVD